MKHLLIALTLALALFANMAFAAGSQTAKAGKYTVELTTDPAPPTVGDNRLTFTVKDGDKPVTGAEVSVHLDMVEMSMPADVKATPPPGSPGQYDANVNLGMEGKWKITASVQGMSGMAMDGDGKTTFSITAQKGNTNTTSAPNSPTQPAPPASLPWPLIIGGVVVVGIVVIVVITRGRPKQNPTV